MMSRPVADGVAVVDTASASSWIRMRVQRAPVGVCAARTMTSRIRSSRCGRSG